MSWCKANRARLVAQQLLMGTAEESYAKMPGYLYMLQVSNPGTHVSLEMDPQSRFKYMFLSLGPWRRAVRHLRQVSVVHCRVWLMVKPISFPASK